MQSSQTVHEHFSEVIDGSGRDRDLHRNAAGLRRSRLRRRFDFDFVVTARFEIGLQPPGNIGDARFGLRLIEKIGDLAPHYFTVVNRPTAKRNVAEKILAPFVNRDRHVRLICLRTEFESRLFNDGIEKSLRQVKAVHDLGAFAHVRFHERQILLQLRIPLARRPDRKLKKLVGRLVHIADKVDVAEGHDRAFVDLEPQSISRLDLVVHAHIEVAVFAIKKFEKEGEIICSRRRQAIRVDGRDLLLELRTQFFFFEDALSLKLNRRRMLRCFFLRLGNGVFLLLLFFRARRIDRRLRASLNSAECSEKKKKKRASHQWNRIKYLTIPLKPPATSTSPINTTWSFTLKRAVACRWPVRGSVWPTSRSRRSKTELLCVSAPFLKIFR